jgi:hypothetical protein
MKTTTSMSTCSAAAKVAAAAEMSTIVVFGPAT